MPPEATANASPAGQQPKRRRVTLADRLRQASKMQFESPEQIAAREALEKMNRESALATPGDTDSHGVSSAVTPDKPTTHEHKAVAESAKDAPSPPTVTSPSPAIEDDLGHDTSAATSARASTGEDATSSATGSTPRDDDAGHPLTDTVIRDVTIPETRTVTHDTPVTPVTTKATGDCDRHPTTTAVTSDTESETVTVKDTSDAKRHPVSPTATDASNSHPVTTAVTPDVTPDSNAHRTTRAITGDSTVTPDGENPASSASSREPKTVSSAADRADTAPHASRGRDAGDDTGHPMTDTVTSDGTSPPPPLFVPAHGPLTHGAVAAADTAGAASVEEGPAHDVQPMRQAEASSAPHASREAPTGTAPTGTAYAGTEAGSAHGHDRTAGLATTAEETPCTPCAAPTPETAATLHDRSAVNARAMETEKVTGTERVTPDATGHPVTAAITVRHDEGPLPVAETPGVSGAESPHVTPRVTQDATQDSTPEASGSTLPGATSDQIGGLTGGLTGGPSVTAAGAEADAGPETGAPYARAAASKDQSDATRPGDDIAPSHAARQAAGISDGATTVSDVTPLSAHDTMSSFVTDDSHGHPMTDNVTTTEPTVHQAMAHGMAPVVNSPKPEGGVHVRSPLPAHDLAGHMGHSAEQAPQTGNVTDDASRHGVSAEVTPDMSAPAPVSPVSPVRPGTPGPLAGLTTSRTLLNSALQVNIYNMVLEAGGAVFTSGGQMAKRFDVAVRSVRRTLDLMETKGILSRESGAAGMTLRLLMDPLSVMGIHASGLPAGVIGAVHDAGAVHDGIMGGHAPYRTGRCPDMPTFPSGSPAAHTPEFVAGHGTGAEGRGGYPAAGMPQPHAPHPSPSPRDSYGHPSFMHAAPHPVQTSPHLNDQQGRAANPGDMVAPHRPAAAHQMHGGMVPRHQPGATQTGQAASVSGAGTPGPTAGDAFGVPSGPGADMAFFRERYPHLARAGFGPAQVKQVREALASRDLPDDLVEESLGYAEWELEHGTMVDAKGQPIAKPADWVFKSLAMHGCYRRPAGYVDPLEEARARIAERIAAQTAHREQLARLREEQEKLEMEALIDAEVERLAAAPDSAEVDELLQGLPAVLRAKGLESALVQREMRRRLRERLFPEG